MAILECSTPLCGTRSDNPQHMAALCITGCGGYMRPIGARPDTLEERLLKEATQSNEYLSSIQYTLENMYRLMLENQK